ncbi:TIP-1 family-domain-containing protein [Peziza echinospora]|nr:TIP-1 family-domain-containing protein [Peziza echinospora]
MSGQDARVEDFLNDKFQTLADLDTLDSLLSTVQSQQSLLRSQLEAAETEVQESEDRAEELSEQLIFQAELFQQDQENIDRRIEEEEAGVVLSEETQQVARELRESADKLKRLNIAKGYVEFLQLVCALSDEARKQIDVNNPKAALVPYNKLQHLSKDLRKRHEETEEAAVHLVDYVERTSRELWDSMKEKLSGEMQAILKKMGWPSTTLDVKKYPEFETAFVKLLDLQEPELEPAAGEVSPALLPLEVMVNPLALRFRYHFEGDKQTNRLDKPEWFFNHVLSLVEDYTPFITTNIQPLLDQYLPNSSRDAVLELITAVLPMLRRRIKNLLPSIVPHAQLLSHFIHEMIKFDTVLRDEYLYAPYGLDADALWKGLTHEVLVKDDWFWQWLKVEKDFALTRYQSIIGADDAWQIDYDSVEDHEAKPTKSAIRLKDLLETITDRYRPLTSFNQRLRFLIDIQISILDQYHERLNSSVEAFRVLSSTIARAVQGTSREEAEALKGIPGLERLCRVYGSSMFLEACMRDWGEDVFFLELWEELQSRSSNHNKDEQLSGHLTIQDIADKTSSAVVSGEDDGALFDETAGAYKTLQHRTEEMIIHHIANSVIEELRAYSRITIWSSIDPDSSSSSGTNHTHTPSSLTLSPEISQPLSTLSSSFSFLARALTTPVFLRIFRHTMANVQTYLYDYIVSRNQFSELGARQFGRDCQELWAVSGRFVSESGGIGNAGVAGSDVATRRLREAVTLLTLPVEESLVAGSGAEGDEKRKVPGLRSVVGVVFEDNEKARRVLEVLGVEALDVMEVRGLLRRRVEAWA